LPENTVYNATYYIDKQGKKLSHPKHKLYYSEGLGFLKYEQQQHSLFLTEQGELIRFNNVLVTAKGKAARMFYPKGNFGFYEGWCTATKSCNKGSKKSNICYYYIDKTGQTVLELPNTITAAGPFSEGLAPAIDNKGQLGYINKQGAWVLQPIYKHPKEHPSKGFAFPKLKNGYIYMPNLGYISQEGKEFYSRE
jgi:hypothetical protein